MSKRRNTSLGRRPSSHATGLSLRGTVGLAAFFLAFAVAAPPVAAQVPDHLKCYTIKDPLNLAGIADLDTPQFGADPGCTIMKAKLFCVPATKTNVSATDRRTRDPITLLPVTGPDPGDRICYKVKCQGAVADQQVTDQFGTRTVGKFRASLVCTPAVKGGPPTTTTTTTTSSTTTTTLRFVDNGNGTVTDRQTGLQWEKKDSAGGGANLANPHDVDNTYRWTEYLSGTTPDGPAFTSFLTTLNGGVTGVGNCTSLDGSTQTGGFAGHCDWRLPTIAELQTIVDCSFGSPCIDPILGPTAGFRHWSATGTFYPYTVWTVNFADGVPFDFIFKDDLSRVRAVRGGP